jgi:ribose 1,5-bisphosphate isomerase
MSQVDWSRYTSVEQIEKDIKTITIQGATNVAIATIHGVILHCSSITFKDWPEFYEHVKTVGGGLANTRPNEPLAKNGVKYIIYMLKTRFGEANTANKREEAFKIVSQEYLDLIKDGKQQIIENSIEVMDGVDEVFTHCHSSTAENVIIARSKVETNLKAVCTETRPLFQGRITAKNLIDSGVDTTMVADSAAESFIIGRGVHGIDVVLIGCDEITYKGDTINKIGSWGVAMASYFSNTPIYVVTSILKMDVETEQIPPKIEMREAKELWPAAPEKLKLINPAFEIVDSKFITGYITEDGILKPEELLAKIKENYSWLY